MWGVTREKPITAPNQAESRNAQQVTNGPMTSSILIG
jgi:hypothetical protein